ncbi:lipopolysaccharide biosynthesis protein [Salinivibrio costicola]|uniref:Oligosaccharide flippase family protein n=1 Tax=Salinivibrio costicola TaxID=51367 RepID=A0ABX6K8F1_SALCS|nr:oligosaccharide flippase family protein [Salinivibrio costicola]QIR06510.1 oligosaccharide flippase family protein [Salinivibrio costicola]
MKINKNLERVLKNSAVVLTGNIGANIFGLLAISIFTKSMGVEVFGYYVIFLSFIEIIDKIFNFQTWQGFIKYSIDFMSRNDRSGFIMLLKFCFFFDMASLFISIVIAYFFSSLLLGFFDIPKEHLYVLIILILSTFFNVFEISVGIFRAFDEFKIQTKITVVSAFLKMASFGLVALVDPKFEYFSYAVFLSQSITFFLKVTQSKKVLERNGYRVKDIINQKIELQKIKDLNILSFIIYNNINTGVRMVSRQLDIVLIGRFFGPDSVGIYRIAKEIGSIAARLSDPIYQTIYPELARLLSLGKHLEAKNVAVKISFYGGVVALITYVVFIFLGEFAITLVFGGEFLRAYDVVLIYYFSILISIIVLPLNPIIFSYGLAKEATINQVIATLVYVIVCFPLIYVYGDIGASFSYIIFYLVWTWVTLNTIKKGSLL